jgi:TonB family protein
MKQIINVLLFILLSSNISYSQNDTIRAYHKGEDYRLKLKFEYPGYAIEQGISGVVEYKFHISANGCLDSLLIINSPHEVLSREVKRAILSLKCDWAPPNSWIFDQFIFNFQ